mgnify:CR=1 FL=1
MRTYRYTGFFKSAEGHTYELTVSCNGFIQAFFLLTADAIRSARHYQLNTITDEKGTVIEVGDICKVYGIFKN